MLHGDIKVNDQVIGSWDARRMTPLQEGPTGVHTYLCTVVWSTRHPLTKETTNWAWAGTVHHAYEDGMLALTMLVLQTAKDNGKEVP